VFLLGAIFTLWITSASQLPVTLGEDHSRKAVADHVPQELGADVAQLKDKASDQAHAMASVAYHFNNLWFAADAKNWPLAEFYWNETRSHLRWAVRIIPVRKDNAGQEVKLQDILEAIENSTLDHLRAAIANNDHEDFVTRYRQTLEACYACHKASDKPYLRPKIPEEPAEPAINFDPQADWPK
jgi:hypothetical protein